MRNKLILIAIIAILAGGAGYYIYSDLVQSPMSNIPAEPTPGVGEENVHDRVVHILDRPINFYVDIPEEAKEIYRKKIEELSSALKENPDLFNHWLDLGIYRQNIGDYEAARDIWEYAGKIRPQNSTSFQNLGYLYAYYLKDNKKAEENYLKALENGPDQVYIYRNTYEFYRYAMKDDARAKEILKKGIELNPDTSQDLQNLLNNF